MPFDVRFQHPCNIMVSSSSGSGKTTLVKNILSLRTQILTQDPEKVFLFYNNDQLIYDEMLREGLIDEKIDASNNFPTLDYLTTLVAPFKKGRGSLVVFDDLISDLTEDFIKIICNMGHHEKTTIILLTQNLFFNHKVFRTLSLNMHYMFLMCNERDKQQVANLGRQVCPNNPNFLVQVYSAAASRPYEYLLLAFEWTNTKKFD